MSRLAKLTKNEATRYLEIVKDPKTLPADRAFFAKALKRDGYPIQEIKTQPTAPTHQYAAHKRGKLIFLLEQKPEIKDTYLHLFSELHQEWNAIEMSRHTKLALTFFYCRFILNEIGYACFLTNEFSSLGTINSLATEGQRMPVATRVILFEKIAEIAQKIPKNFWVERAPEKEVIPILSTAQINILQKCESGNWQVEIHKKNSKMIAYIRHLRDISKSQIRMDTFLKLKKLNKLTCIKEDDKIEIWK